MEYVPKDESSQSITFFSALFGIRNDSFPKCIIVPHFLNTRTDIFTRIHEDIEKLKKRKSFEPIAAQLEDMMFLVEQTRSPIYKLAPCHNDLHPGNLFYSNATFKLSI